MGPNGAGKTILLKALLGLIPHQGEIHWKKGIKIGYVPQRVPLNKDLPITVIDFFRLKQVSKRDSLAVLRNVGVTEESFLDKPLGTLSSGNFQRVLIAWALIPDPQVILFDEATAGIDIGGEDLIHSFLHQKKDEQKLAIILVTHDLTAVYSEATRVLCLNGQKSCYGLPQEVLQTRRLQDIYGRELKYYRHNHD